MFQYAFGKTYAHKNKCDVLFDRSWFDLEQGEHPRPLRLTRYNVSAQFASKLQVEQCINKRRASRLPGFLRQLFKKKKYTSNKRLEQCAGFFDPSLMEPSVNCFFEGYFQTDKYFKDIRGKILSDFTLASPLDESNQQMLHAIQNSNAISIHIRRGDYLNLQDTHPVCSMEYYQTAMKSVARSVDKPHFFIFSDDPNWVKSDFPLAYDKTVVDINNEENGIFDIELMRHCQHNIIANSSFSWWGAWLNENPDKMVVAPKQWFSGKAADDILPEEWIKL